MDTLVKVSPERFAEGLTMDEFRQGMQKNKEIYEGNYNSFSLRPQDAEFLQNYGHDLRLVVLVEDWCGDVLRYLPVLDHMCEAAGSWDVRVFYRDENPDLADLWLKEGRFRAIPVIAFHDQQMREIACYVEKPAVVYKEDERGKNAFVANYCDLTDASLPTSQMSEATLDLYGNFMRRYRLDNRARWQQWFVDEVIEKLQKAAYLAPDSSHLNAQ